MSLPDWWSTPYPQVSSPDAAMQYLDRLGGAITRQQEDGAWVLRTGPQELFRAPTPDQLDAFLLGFALATSICERHGFIGARSGQAPAAPQPSPEVTPEAGADESGDVAPVVPLERSAGEAADEAPPEE